MQGDLWNYNIGASDFVLVSPTSNVIGIVWPEKITYHMSKKGVMGA